MQKFCIFYLKATLENCKSTHTKNVTLRAEFRSIFLETLLAGYKDLGVSGNLRFIMLIVAQLWLFILLAYFAYL